MSDYSHLDTLITWQPKRVSAHAEKTARVDVSCLVEGRNGSRAARPFRGRPQLAAILIPEMRACAKKGKLQKVSLQVMLQDVTPFYRFLDEMEDAAAAQSARFRAPTKAYEVPGHVWGLFTQWLGAEGNERAHFLYSTCKRLFSMAAAHEDAQGFEFFLPPNPFPSPQKTRRRNYASASDESDLCLADLRAISSLIRQQVEGTDKRFALASRVLRGNECKPRAHVPYQASWTDRHAAVARAIADMEAEIDRDGIYPRKISGLEVWRRAGVSRATPLFQSADLDVARAKVREFVKRVQSATEILPSNDSFEWHIWGSSLGELHALGDRTRWDIKHLQHGTGTYIKFPEAMPATVQQIAEGLHAFVPRKNDLMAAVGLLIMQNGWNLSTALDIDANNWWRPHPTHPDLVVQMFAPKVRAGGSVQHSFSSRQKKFRPFDLVNRVLEWTEPLRAAVRDQYKEVIAELAKNPQSRRFAAEQDRLQPLLNRVWLYLNLDGRITSLAKADMKWTWMNRLLARADIRLAGKPVRFTQELTRKSYAVFVYETSGYNLVITQVALGHKDFSSLVAYLDRKRVRRHNRRAWLQLQGGVIRSLEQGALLRRILAKQLRTGELSPEEVKRLEDRSTRTRQGLLCTDPWQPDPEADLGHRPGQLCREQRCLTGCRRAYATWDTAQWLALYVLELRRRRDLTPLPLWHECDDAIDLQIAEEVLSKYSEKNQVAAFKWAKGRLQTRAMLPTLPSTHTLKLASS